MSSKSPGGQPRLVPTFPGADNGAPNWSRDGQWIYFYSDHQGRPFQLWKTPLKGGAPVRVTRNGWPLCDRIGGRTLSLLLLNLPRRASGKCL